MRSGIQESALSLALGLALAGCAPGAPPGPPPPPRVTVARPEERQLVDHDEYNGWLDAPESVEVRARVRGHIMKVHFQDGDIIKEGDPLFALDKRPFQAEVDRIRDQVRVFEAQKVAAEREFTRLRDLLARGGSSQSQVDKAEADAKALEAQIQATQKDMERRQLDVEFCDLTAPIGGRVSRALLTEGNLVNAGGSDPLLTTIVALDPIYVYFSVGERAFQRYQKRHGERAPGSSPTTVREQNMPFTFGLDSDAGYPHAGVLNFADNRVDRATGTILARGETQNTDRRFVPGARVRVRLPVSDPYTALLVADTAVLSDQDKKYLLVLGDGQNVLRRDVELGKLVDDDMRVILPGRKEGEGLTKDTWVIILGLQRARLNYPVEPVDASGEPLSPAGTSAPSIPPGDSKP